MSHSCPKQTSCEPQIQSLREKKKKVILIGLLVSSFQVDVLNAEKTALSQQTQNDKVLMLAQEKKMALCEICGSFLVANDAAERVQSHVTGKQHVGYGMVRDFISEHKVNICKTKGRFSLFSSSGICLSGLYLAGSKGESKGGRKIS